MGIIFWLFYLGLFILSKLSSRSAKFNDIQNKIIKTSKLIKYMKLFVQLCGIIIIISSIDNSVSLMIEGITKDTLLGLILLSNLVLPFYFLLRLLLRINEATLNKLLEQEKE